MVQGPTAQCTRGVTQQLQRYHLCGVLQKYTLILTLSLARCRAGAASCILPCRGGRPRRAKRMLVPLLGSSAAHLWDTTLNEMKGATRSLIRVVVVVLVTEASARNCPPPDWVGFLRRRHICEDGNPILRVRPIQKLCVPQRVVSRRFYYLPMLPFVAPRMESR